MNILYVHGFGSHYDPNDTKIKILEMLGTVVGANVDYCNGFRDVFESVLEIVLTSDIDLIVGTSMGGYMAAHVGAKTGVPFVALNPTIEPGETLQRYVGVFIDFAGNDRCLTEVTVENYPVIIQEGCGLVLLDSGDEVLNANTTQNLLSDVFNVKVFPGGAHRFTHLEEALPDIKVHMSQASTSYDA